VFHLNVRIHTTIIYNTIYRSSDYFSKKHHKTYSLSRAIKTVGSCTW